MNTRLVRFVLLAAFALLGTGADCGREIPPAMPFVPYGPDSTWVGVSTAYKVTTTIREGRIRYVVDWGDAMDTTDASYASGETATVVHTWTAPGEVSVRVQAINENKPDKASQWSSIKSVRVIANQLPVIDNHLAPPVAVKDVPAFFTVVAHDPDGDSVRTRADWGDGSDTTTGFFASPCTVGLSHVFSAGETAWVVFTAIDYKGAESKPDTACVPVGTAGGVVWYWYNDEQGAMTTSVLIVEHGGEEYIYAGCEDDWRFYVLDGRSGRGGGSVSTKFLGHIFSGHPAYCAATGHIIVGSGEGELYAFNLDLTKAWQWPNAPNEDSLRYQEWGAPAIIGNKIYVARANDSMYYFVDADSQGVLVAAYGVVGAGIVDAPAIDVQGNVYFSTDSGYLYKMDANLSAPIWRTPLQGNGEIHGPIIGGDGTIYCTSDSFHLFAVDPATGAPKWTITLDGEAMRPALGSSALYVGTSYGKIYSINPATGGINWQKQLGTDAFETTPIVVSGGYVCFQNSGDILYNVNQADGTVIWSCDCKKYLPRSGGRGGGNPRRLQLTDYAPNPSILSNGNIIVVGEDALYCVAGYPERPLDPTAPWPKWQHDKHNTGYVGGGR